jgi:hypothetical protein
MIEFACLTKLARPMFHVVLTYRFVGSKREQGLRGICSLHPPATLYISRMVVLARPTVLASSSAKIVSTIFLVFGRPSLRVLCWGRHVSNRMLYLSHYQLSTIKYRYVEASLLATHQNNDEQYVSVYPTETDPFQLVQIENILVGIQRAYQSCAQHENNNNNNNNSDKF